MKNIQIFSKYLIYFTLIWIPLVWASSLYFEFFYSFIPLIDISFISLMFYISWISLLFVMVIRPISELFPKYSILKQLIFLRKAFGILSATIIVLNLSGTALIQDGFWSNYFSLPKWSLWYPLIARIAELSAIILLATSNMWSMKKLKKNWKKVQRLSYPYFISGWIVAAQFEPKFYYISMWVVAFIYIINIIKKYLIK